MTTAIDLGGVRLAEDRPTWLHAFPVGTYQHPVHGELHFTRQRLEAIADGVNRGVRGIIPALDFDHREDRAKGGKAAGWIEAAEVRADGLWIAVEWTAEALAEVRAGHWRYLSPEFGTWIDPWTGVRHSDVLLGAALTNRPFLRDLAPVAACEPASWPAATAAEVDPQAEFVRLAEQADSYQVAAREHPEVWAAARAAADLNGSNNDDPGVEVDRLVEQAMAEHGLTLSEATYMVMYQRPDLWERSREVNA
jgi:hypothetical protein